MYRNLRRNFDGFTMVEILVVVLIMAVLMAVAIPLYVNATGTAQRTQCRANMQTISNAEHQYQLKYSGANGPTHGYMAVNNTTDLATLFTYSGGLTTVTCPNGGAYTVVVTGSTTGTTNDSRTIPVNSYAVECSYGTHGSFMPGDSN